MDVTPFKPSLVRVVFRTVTPMHISRQAAWAAASVTRTVLAEIIDGARGAAAHEARKKLLPRGLLSAIDRNVELEVGVKWYDHSPTFHGLTGVLYDADGAMAAAGKRSRSRRPSALVGAHRFEAGVKKILRSQGATATPAMVRDLDGIRRGDTRTIGRGDVLAAATVQLFGGNLGQRALTEAHRAAQKKPTGQE